MARRFELTGQFLLSEFQRFQLSNAFRIPFPRPSRKLALILQFLDAFLDA
jgi:hypothetical protein